MNTLLDCGHPNDWTENTGCRAPDGRSLCRSCANEMERDAMSRSDRHFAYVVRGPSGVPVAVSDWGGLILGERIGMLKASRRMVSFRVKDRSGTEWTCRHWPDAGDYVRMKRAR